VPTNVKLYLTTGNPLDVNIDLLKISLDSIAATTFPPSTHNHNDLYYTEEEINLKKYLHSQTDERDIDTIPNDYNSKFDIKGLKKNSVIGITDEGTYSGVLGMRGWGDSSGGNAHEFALTQNGNIKHRHGATDTWNNWKTIAFLESFAEWAKKEKLAVDDVPELGIDKITNLNNLLSSKVDKSALDNKNIDVITQEEYNNLGASRDLLNTIYFIY